MCELGFSSWIAFNTIVGFLCIFLMVLWCSRYSMIQNDWWVEPAIDPLPKFEHRRFVVHVWAHFNYFFARECYFDILNLGILTSHFLEQWSDKEFGTGKPEQNAVVIVAGWLNLARQVCLNMFELCLKVSDLGLLEHHKSPNQYFIWPTLPVREGAGKRPDWHWPVGTGWSGSLGPWWTQKFALRLRSV